jgi:hypothetical protein
MKQAKLNCKYFSHLPNELIQILQNRGSGLFLVRFENGETSVIGKSSFALIFN